MQKEGIFISQFENTFIIYRANLHKNNEITYFQVTESLINDSTRNREIHPFQCIDDHYDKIILSLDKGYSNINGIKVINLIDWLLQ